MERRGGIELQEGAGGLPHAWPANTHYKATTAHHKWLPALFPRLLLESRTSGDECAAFMLWPVRLACAWGWLRRCVLGQAEQI